MQTTFLKAIPFSAMACFAMVLAVAFHGDGTLNPQIAVTAVVLAIILISGNALQEFRLGPGRRERDDRLRLLESAIVHANDAVVILAATSKTGSGRSVLYVNDAFCRMSGYAREEVLGRSLHLLRGPESDPDSLMRIRNALDAERPLQIELRNYSKDGVPFWVDLSLVPVRDDSGGLGHWVMIQRDVTGRKQAEEDLRRSEGLFRGIFEGASAGVSLTDASGRFVSCNPAFAAMLGRTPAEMAKLTPQDITHPEDWETQKPFMNEVFAGTRDRFHHHKRYVRPGGELVWAELSFAAIRGRDGAFEYGLGVSVNVTERRRLEEQLLQVQKMEAVGQLAGGIAHDFNNLLTAVIGNLDLVTLPDTDPNRALLESAEQAAVRAADLTRKLLGFARKNHLVAGPVRPAQAFEEVISLLGRTFDPRIRIFTEVEPDCGAVLADSTLLIQALLNLCLNARDAMPEGGSLYLIARPVVVTSADAGRHTEARTGPFVRVSVRDTGCGMTAAVRSRMFEPFFTTKDVGKGTGLGLSMVHGIVKQHRGWVDCSSEPDQGTRIDLYLPLAEENASSKENSRRSPVSVPRGYPKMAASPRSAIATILLVDDEAMIRKLGGTVLENAGYRVLTAEDGAEAIEVFRANADAIDLIVLDVTMPRMSGRDAFRKLVEIRPTVRVLFSTGFSSQDILDLQQAAGLLNKPYRPDELLTAVREALTEGSGESPGFVSRPVPVAV